MLKKITLFLLICSIIFSGFAQKSKRKIDVAPPKSTYFEILVNGYPMVNGVTPRENYCPGDTILFVAYPKTTLQYDSISWYDNYSMTYQYDTLSVKYSFPLLDKDIYSYYKVNFYYKIITDTVPFFDTLTANIKIGYDMDTIPVKVCKGRGITIQTKDHGNLVYTDIQSDVYTPYDTYQNIYGCDSLVLWAIEAQDYITEEYSITSCDSVIWGTDTLRKLPIMEGDLDSTMVRIFKHPSWEYEPCCDCDTMRILKVKIIDTRILVLDFKQDEFCAGDDMKGKISVEGSNFTAFYWLNQETGVDTTLFNIYKYDIEEPGNYYVHAYMDTSLYDTLKDLRIVNCSLSDTKFVEDCPLIIPNIFTPDGDASNQWFGIKKLNVKRQNELNIYDRWGKNVFRQKNYKCVYKNSEYLNTEEAFEGISRGGQELPEGVYYYAFWYDAIPKSQKKTYTGIVTILRKK